MKLRIGILECDHVAPELIKKYGDYHEMFADLLLLQDNLIEFIVYDLIANQFPVDLSSCDAYIITGSKFSVYENIPWINKSKQMLRRLHEIGIPTVGICFGHQLIAESLGGKVVKAIDKGRGLGVQTWEIKAKSQGLSEISSKSLSLNACHQDQVIEMPKESELLVGSDFCPIGSFKIGSMLGIQGHPEFGSEYTHHLFEKYKETSDEQSTKIAEESFNIPVNSDYVGSYMLNFIKSKLNRK